MHAETLVGLTGCISRASVHVNHRIAANLGNTFAVVFALSILLSRRRRHGRQMDAATIGLGARLIIIVLKLSCVHVAHVITETSRRHHAQLLLLVARVGRIRRQFAAVRPDHQSKVRLGRRGVSSDTAAGRSTLTSRHNIEILESLLTTWS